MDVFLDVNICLRSRMAVKNEFKYHLYKILYSYAARFVKQLQNGVVVQSACY